MLPWPIRIYKASKDVLIQSIMHINVEIDIGSKEKPGTVISQRVQVKVTIVDQIAVTIQ